MKRKTFFVLMLVLLSSQAAYGMSRIKRIKNGVCYWLSEFLEFAEQEGLNDCQFYSRLYCEKELICAKIVRQAMNSAFMKKLLEGKEKNLSPFAKTLNDSLEGFDVTRKDKAEIFKRALELLLEEWEDRTNKFCDEKGVREQDKVGFFKLVCEANILPLFNGHE